MEYHLDDIERRKKNPSVRHIHTNGGEVIRDRKHENKIRIYSQLK
jgi:hypothetical protein